MKKTIVFQNKTFQIDIGFFAILFILWITSCFAIYNSFNLIKDGGGTGYLMRQIFWYSIGFMAVFFLTSIQNHVIYSHINRAYQILLACLGYLFASRMLSRIIGITLPLAPSINGAVSWLRIPLLGSFQPSEFIKIVLIIMVSKIIQDHQELHPNPTYLDDLNLLRKIGKVLLVPLTLIFLQPDTGLCIIILFTIMVLLMCSGIRRSYVIAILVALLFVVIFFFYMFMYHRDVLASIFSNYRLQRIEAWLDPESNIQGSSNQLYTALLSLGSAGLTGFGLQANIISIPEAHTDFIFAAIGQCFGLVGTTTIVGLCLLLDLYLCKIAYNTKKRQDRLIVIGVIAMLLYQQIQNLGMIVGLFPITGITLPLISYGGSSTLSYFIAFAIVMNISPSTKKALRIRNRF